MRFVAYPAQRQGLELGKLQMEEHLGFSQCGCLGLQAVETVRAASDPTMLQAVEQCIRRRDLRRCDMVQHGVTWCGMVCM